MKKKNQTNKKKRKQLIQISSSLAQIATSIFLVARTLHKFEKIVVADWLMAPSDKKQKVKVVAHSVDPVKH